ncbi:MAG TPA: DUF1871 domain-containing protein [Meiothermus sp.]|jgi:hypothetical protein|nr:DUF1871 domain-containing protein [Meiothermus sp.]
MTEADAKAHIRNYLDIYDPLGMAEMGVLDQLYDPVLGEVLELIRGSQSAQEVAAGVYRILFLAYGTGAGNVRNYADLGRDLFGLKARMGS